MIARMERAEIVCMRADLPGVIAYVQDQGVLHVEEVPLVVENAPDFLQRVRLTDQQREDLASLEDIERTLREVMPLLQEPVNREAIEAKAKAIATGGFEDWSRKAKQWARELRSLTRRKVNIRDNVEILQNYRHILKTLEPVLRERNVTMGAGARAMVLEGTATKTVDRLKSRFEKEIASSTFVWEKSGRKSIVAFVTYPESMERAAGQILHEEGVAPVDAPDKDLRGAPVEVLLRRLDENIAGQNKNLEQIEADTLQFARDHGDDLAAISLTVNDRLAQIRVVNQFAQSQMIGVLEGWIPADDIPSFTDKLTKKFGGNVVVTPLGAEKLDPRRIPTLLKNKKFFKPFEVLLSIFRPPTYGAYDPTVLVAVAFILFYGFILGDVVYGLAVIAFARFLGKKWGHIEAVRNAAIVGRYMGISGIVFGVLFGEYAGGLGEQIFGFLKPVWFHRAHETNFLLQIAIIVGAIHIPIGLILGIWENYRHHHTKHAIEKLGMLLGLTAAGILIMGVLGIAPFTAFAVKCAGVVILLTGIALLIKSMGGMAAVGALEILSLIGNVLSYARLMALGIASIAIADIANQALQLTPWLGVPLALFIHLFNVALGMFSPTIHSLRLNYVEFFSKFYTPEGKSYKPFRKEATW